MSDGCDAMFKVVFVLAAVYVLKTPFFLLAPRVGLKDLPARAGVVQNLKKKGAKGMLTYNTE